MDLPLKEIKAIKAEKKQRPLLISGKKDLNIKVITHQTEEESHSMSYLIIVK